MFGLDSLARRKLEDILDDVHFYTRQPILVHQITIHLDTIMVDG